MSILTKLEVRSFLIQKKGYIKKSPINVAKAIWKTSDKHRLPKTKSALEKELSLIREVQANLRIATNIVEEIEDNSLVELYEQVLAEKERPKRRLFFDLEVSANIVFSWNVGRKINIGPESIIQERAIICACYKWEDEDKIYSIEWNRGDDKALVKKLAEVINSADEVIGQNSDQFDIKWLRTRCIYHGVPISPKLNSIDTLKMARSGFRFNSNKLNYMGKFLGLGEKIHTEYDLWKDITLNNSKEAMNKMVAYCKQDVKLLEDVYVKLQEFSPVKKFKYKIK